MKLPFPGPPLSPINEYLQQSYNSSLPSLTNLSEAKVEAFPMPVSITSTELPETARSGPQIEEGSISSVALPNNEVSSTSTDHTRWPDIPPAPPFLPEKRSSRTIWLYLRRGELFWYLFDNHSNYQPEDITPPESARNRAEVARLSTADRERERQEREERESLNSDEKRTKREAINSWLTGRGRRSSSGTYKPATCEPIPEDAVNPTRVSEQSSGSPNSLHSSTTSRRRRLSFLPRHRPGRGSFSKPSRHRHLYTSFDMAIRKGQQEWKGVQKVADEVSKSQPGSRRGSQDLSSSAKKSKKENMKPEQPKADNQADKKLLNAVVAEALNMKPSKTEAKSDPPKLRQHNVEQEKEAKANTPKAKQPSAKQEKQKKVNSGTDLDGSASSADDIELVKFPTAIHVPSEKHPELQEKRKSDVNANANANARPKSSYGIRGEGRSGISRSTSLQAATESQGKEKGKVEKACSMADLLSGSGSSVAARKPVPQRSSDGLHGKGGAIGGAGLSRSNAKKQTNAGRARVDDADDDGVVRKGAESIFEPRPRS